MDDQVIKNLADLARIRVTEEERKTLQKELGEILSYVSALEGVDTKDVPRDSQSPIINVLRDDNQVIEGDPEALLQEAPERKGDFYVVKKVIAYDN